MRRMCDSAAGPRLSGPVRRSRTARLRHVAAQVAEAAAVVALLVGVALAARLANGPIYLQSLHDKIASSLQERAGDRYAIDLGPTYLMHDSWGVGLGFRHLTVRDAAGRTVVAAPAGKIGLDVLGLLFGAREGPAARTGRPRPSPQSRGRTAPCRSRSLATRAPRRSRLPAGGRVSKAPISPRSSAPAPRRWRAPGRRSTG